MITSGVIVNPRSGRGSGKGQALAEALDGNQHIRVTLLNQFAELEACLTTLAAEEARYLFVSSGDGTVQAIQTLIAEKKLFKTAPLICLLPHGTTNMTAADLGFKLHPIAAQAAYIAHPAPVELRTRPTLRVANPRDCSPRHGMFLGTGAAMEATRYTQTALNDRGIKGDIATFVTLAGAVGRSILSPANSQDPRRFDRPFPITVRANGAILCTGNQLLALATTLDKLILGTTPFWGGKTGPIRVTIFPYPLPNIVRWLLPAIYGGENRNPPPGAMSLALSGFEIETPVDFVIDGEFFSPPAGEALRIETGAEFTYIIR